MYNLINKLTNVALFVSIPLLKIGTAVEDYAHALRNKGYIDNARMVKTSSFLLPVLTMQFSAANGFPVNPLIVGALTYSAEALTAIFLRPVVYNSEQNEI